MPTVMGFGPYHFFFYSNERDEPAHIHVRRVRALAKFCVEPVALSKSKHFAAHDLNVIRQHVEDNVRIMMEAWNEYLNRRTHATGDRRVVHSREMIVALVDGRRLCVPLAWFARLAKASPEQLQKFELMGDGEGIHLPESDKDLSVAGLLG